MTELFKVTLSFNLGRLFGETHMLATSHEFQMDLLCDFLTKRLSGNVLIYMYLLRPKLIDRKRIYEK